VARSGPANEQAGIVFYRRSGNRLAGKWSHVNEKGLLCDEVVGPIPAGALTGTWPVHISDSSGRRIFDGALDLETFGQCLKLTWRGDYLPAGVPVRFEGIGCQIDRETLCATFARVDLPPPPA